MAGGAQRHALGYRVCQMEQLAKRRSHATGHDAGEDDGGGGDGADAAGELTQGHADGGGDALREQGNGQFPVKAHRQGEQQYHHETAHRAHRDAQGDGLQVLFQDGQLLVHGDGKGNGGRGHQPGELGGARLIGAVVHAGEGYEDEHDHHGDEDGIAQGRADLLLTPEADLKGDQRQGQGKDPDGEQLRHGYPPFSSASV